MPVKADLERQQALLPVVGIVAGLVGGGLNILALMLLFGGVLSTVDRLTPPFTYKHELGLVLPALLYAGWVLLLRVLVRRSSVVFWALSLLPLPSLLIGYLIVEFG